jgi:Ca2+-binding EF-hand superfamily protein
MKKMILISAAAAALLAAPTIAQDQMPTVEQIMGFLDANKDGFIDKTEAKGPMVEYFDIMDADKDTKISATELQTAMDMRAKAMSQQGGGEAPAAAPAGE